MYVAQLTMQWKYRNESYNAIYIAHLIPKNIFITVSLFSVMALYAKDLWQFNLTSDTRIL